MTQSQPTRSKIIRFLGSMNLAITLLVVLGIASVVGTVLQQNRPYTDYEIKFGSFWFEVFRMLGLYDVYSALWFLLILFFLLLSTATCIVRNTPGFLREIAQFREHVQEKSLRLMKSSYSLSTQQSPDNIQKLSRDIFSAQGYKFRIKQSENHTVIAAKKGSSHYWGYWLTHLGIIVILIGGVMDSRLPLMISEWQGTIKPELRNIPASQVPKESTLSTNNYAYRGQVDISEGQRANIIFLPVRDGYYVQRLPFEVEVKEFRVEHYSTGQPKSFESDIVIHDKDLDKPLEKTIAVNHPLIHKGIAIYQANFGDGGSEVKLKFHPFKTSYVSQTLDGKVFQDYQMKHPDGSFKLEITNFRAFNIIPIENEKGEEEQRNIGPSVTFKLRDEAGEAVEFTNYMLPVPVDGKRYILSGIRNTPSDPLRYLHIPLDDKGQADGFLKFLRNLQDAELVSQAATASTQASMEDAKLSNPDIEKQVVASMVHLTRTFATRGFDGIADDIASRFPENQRQSVNEAFMKVLNTALRATYLETLKQQGITELKDHHWEFYDDSLSAIANLPFYGSPWYVQLQNFKQIEASGLQMARAPGKNVVYLGCLMLTIGIFLMFYIANRRIWVWFKNDSTQQNNEILLAGTTNRHADEFKELLDKMQQAFQQASARS